MRVIDLERVDGGAVGARIDLRGEDIDAVRGQRARDQREESRHVAGGDDELGGVQIGMVEQLRGDDVLFEPLHEAEMRGDALGRRRREIAVRQHREVLAHRAPRPLPVHGLPHAHRDGVARRRRGDPPGEPGERPPEQLAQDLRLPSVITPGPTARMSAKVRR